MKTYRTDAPAPTPLFDVTWNEDKQYRMDPGVVTELLREQVPVLDFVDWNVDLIEPGYTESTLPLNAPSTNQHFTHQGALLLLVAEYTAGTALASLLTGWPVVGVHPVKSSKSVSMWLLKCEIKYLRPSVADLKVRSNISDARREVIRKRFMAGKTIIETLDIEFLNGDEPVAEASLTIFARQSEKIRIEGIHTEKINTLYQLKLTSSAELIAGVRARESGRLFHDPYAALMAGDHGLALATRFCQRSKELGGMIAARTWHLDRTLREFLEQGGRDIVVVGVGWDMRPFRLPLPKGTTFYELDFPTTLEERERRIAQLDLETPVGGKRISVPADVRTMPLCDVLEGIVDPDRSILMMWEGMSMYFEEREVRAVLAGMAPLLKNPESLLWVDLVDKQAVFQPESISPSVETFMRGMQILGEPFTFGVDSIEQFMASAGFECRDVVTSDVCLRDHSDPVYDIYRFCVASPVPAAIGRLPHTRPDAGAEAIPRPHITLDDASLEESPTEAPRDSDESR